MWMDLERCLQMELAGLLTDWIRDRVVSENRREKNYLPGFAGGC